MLRGNPLEVWTRRHFEESIVLEKLFFREVAVVNEPRAIRHVLLDNVDNYVKGGIQRRVLGHVLRNGLLLAEGKQWRNQRRVLAGEFSHKSVRQFAPAMCRAIDDMIRRWRSLGDGAVLDIAVEMSALTLDTLTRTLFPEGFGGDRVNMQQNMRLFFDNVGRIDAFDLLGLPDFVPRFGRSGARAAEIFFDSSVRRLLSTRRRRPEIEPDGSARDLLTLMLAARDDHGEFILSDEEIRANLITFISAGHETTANALTWALYLLTLSKPWRQRVVEEARAAGGEAERLTATRAVLEEALRLYPPLAAISREAAGPDELAGCRIGAGALIVIAPYVLHRHRLWWDRPDAFDPTRFMPENRAAIPRYAYMPFGAGPRICIGAAFALQEATLALAAIMREFKLDVATGHRVWPRQGLTLRPGEGLRMIVRRRTMN
jgi:cytochrome P450